MDFVARSRLRGDMDEDNADLIALLCSRVGMIMEDSCDLALRLGEAAPERRSEGLLQLEAAADQISKLLQAARVLGADVR